MKNIKIMSGRKLVFEGKCGKCEGCPIYFDDSDYGPHCLVLGWMYSPDDWFPFESVNPNCPLDDELDNITYKDD